MKVEQTELKTGQKSVLKIDHQVIGRFRSHLARLGRHSATVDCYGRDGSAFLKFLDRAGVETSEIGPKTIDEYQEYLRSTGHVNNSIRRSVIGVRQLFRYIQEEHGLGQSPIEESIIPKRTDVFRHRLTPMLIDRIFADARRQSVKLKALRDQVMLGLLGYEGLKVNELIHLCWKDFLHSSKSSRLRIQGERPRLIDVEPLVAQSLQELRDHTKHLALKSGKLFSGDSRVMVGFKGAGLRLVISELTRHGVKFALYELGKHAEVDHLNSEDLRHHAIAHKVGLGLSNEEVMVHLGLRTPGKTRLHSATE